MAGKRKIGGKSESRSVLGHRRKEALFPGAPPRAGAQYQNSLPR